jgi:hypothetical protein
MSKTAQAFQFGVQTDAGTLYAAWKQNIADKSYQTL